MSMLILVLFGATLVVFSDAQPTPVSGLSYTFYKSSCPKLESIIRTQLKKDFNSNISLAAGLLRLHFHDCFVQGCDASVLLDGSASGPSEQEAPPNLTLQQAAFKAINDLRALIDAQCGKVVSCADVVAIAARDSVALVFGEEGGVATCASTFWEFRRAHRRLVMVIFGGHSCSHSRILLSLWF